jgi:pimeloyl-ACP methyl ester carboxylesterase
MSITTPDGVTIHVVDEGAGDAVLMIHGHTFDHRTFDPQAPALLAAGRRLIRPDLRGHGQSERPPAGYHTSFHAADMLAVLDQLEVASAHVVGFSVGGGVALELALAAPERVRTLTLLAPVMPDRRFEDAFMANLKDVARAVRSEGIEAAMTGPWMESPLFAASFAKPGVRDAVAAAVATFPGAEYLAEARDRIDRDWTVPERLSEIRAPTQVMVGALEMEGFRGFADEAANGIPLATLEVVPDAGHLLPLEEPALVTQAILRFTGGAA